jgi:hypothetical protein
MASSVLDAGAGRLVAPYVTAWSGEEKLPGSVVEVPGVGIGYADETTVDRDRHGVLWSRREYRPGAGRPLFGRVHPMRQRRAMRRLLCSVCGDPASVSDDGVLWLLPVDPDEWRQWPDGQLEAEPPVCVPCVRVAVRVCPALRRTAVAFRVRRCPIVGVHGGLWARAATSKISTGGVLRLVDDTTARFNDPAIRYVQAINQVRQLEGCRLVDLAELVR